MEAPLSATDSHEAKSKAKKVELQAAMNAFTDPLEKEASASHDALRAEIYAAHPDLDSEEVHSLDTDYVEQGIMMLIKPRLADKPDELSKLKIATWGSTRT